MVTVTKTRQAAVDATAVAATLPAAKNVVTEIGGVALKPSVGALGVFSGFLGSIFGLRFGFAALADMADKI